MGTVLINTPQGVAEVTIAGDTPTQEELDRLRQLAPSDDPTVGFDYSMVQEEVEEEVEEPPKPDLPEEEVKDSALRFQVGRMDNDEERLNLLTQKLGQGTVERVADDTFIIDQEKVAPEIREQYGLSDTGKIYFDRPGFSWYDLVDFGGESGPAVASAIGASLMATGVGFFPGMAIVGAAAAGGKAIDEGIEYLQGLNKQSAGEVASAIAIEGVLNAAFEGTGRLIAKGVGRLIKGPGPEVSAQRIDELVAKGMKPGAARRAAREEGLAQYRQAIAEGARPTIQAATGKALAARALAINEKIIPNPKVGRDNVRFVRETIKDLNEGRLTQEEASQLLKEEAKALANMVTQKLANPDEAYALAQRHLNEVVKTELKAFEDAFVPAVGVPNQYSDVVKLSARLFQGESAALYDIAQNMIGKDILNFSTKGIKDAVTELKASNKFVDFDSGLLKVLDDPNLTGMSLADMTQLKQALRLSIGDPQLVPAVAQAGVSRIIKAVDETLDGRFIELSKDLARGFRVKQHPAGAVSPTGEKIGGKFYKEIVSPAESDALRQGLGKWKQANEFYAEGQDQFNNTAVNMILKNTKDRFYNSNVDVVKQIVDPGNAPKLKMYLDAATPRGVAVTKLSQPGATDAILRARSLVEAGEFAQADEFIKASGLADVVPKLNAWIGKLPEDDIFRTMHVESYLKEMDDLAQIARGGGDPTLVREAARNGLATEWMDQTKLLSMDSRGVFAPGKFAANFKKLGDETQDLLFGKETATTMRNVMDDFHLVGAKQDELLAALPSVRNQTLKSQVQVLKDAVEANIDESRSAVLNSIREGTTTDPKTLVAGILRDPSSYNRLRAVVGDDELGKVGGVKDMVMNNLIHNSFKTPLDEASIQSGAWGKALKDAIKAQDSNGGLSNILGVDTVKSLTSLADDAIKISDIPIKGFGGIAAAPAAMAIVAGMTNPATWAPTLGTVGTVILLSRALRNRGILKLMTSSKVRAREYEAAIKAGAELPTRAEQRQAGQISYALNKIFPIMSSEASIIAGSGILGVPAAESAKEATALDQQGVQPGAPHLGGLPPLPSSISREEAVSLAQNRGLYNSGEVLREVEQEKLLGVR